MNKYSLSEEDYLKAIYHLEDEAEGGVSTNKIAQQVDSKASSVTDMMKKLVKKNLISYVPYKGVNLTKTGRKVALRIVRKHRLWETFLVKKLQFKWDEVHDIAEQLEHIRSPQLIDRLDNHLGHPAIDPHGDPIPDADGNMREETKIPLTALKAPSKFRLLAVDDSSTELLQFLDKNKLQLGSVLQLEEVEPFDKSCQVRHQGKPLTLSALVAEKLFVKPLAS